MAWDWKKFKRKFAMILAIIGAVLLLGAIILACLTVVGWPLALGLVLIGLVLIATAFAIDREGVQEVVDKVSEGIEGALGAIGQLGGSVSKGTGDILSGLLGGFLRSPIGLIILGILGFMLYRALTEGKSPIVIAGTQSRDQVDLRSESMMTSNDNVSYEEDYDVYSDESYNLNYEDDYRKRYKI